ncbi:LytR/AlgR family response regulator transcription factor [Sphingobacterium sp. T2]|uniref:LytR/AlgR family response regulator transcription factor n=1 Tax=Sphingobacterium sp. T2 TaxID=1590596 RepID=UPI0029350804|nr:response regulator [Sphingobacterium sp. T2]
MIKAIIIDDEPLARMIIHEYLQKQEGIEVVAECGDGFEGAKAIQQFKPDLVFLDIQMPKLTGFEMLEIIDELPHIIFTTAFEEYALKAFEKNAVDYLLKPISEDRFNQAIQKFYSLYNTQQKQESINALKQDLEEETLERIVVKNGTQIKLIPVQQIIFLEAYDDYVKIHTKDGMYHEKQNYVIFRKTIGP